MASLTPAQAEIARDNHRFRVVCCGRRFGKTVLSVEEMIGVAVAKPDRKVAYIAPTFQQARDIAWEALKKRALPITLEKNESRLELNLRTQFAGNSSIALRGWEAVETLRGQRFDFLVLDEASMYRNFWTGWHEVLRPTLTDTKGGAMFPSTPRGFNHYYDLYNSTDPEFQSFHFTSYDNPHIPREEIDKAREEMTEDRFFQEYMADFRKMEGLVYKEFDRKIHVYDPDNLSEMDRAMLAEPKLILGGVDFGYTNPAAVLTARIDAMDNWWITDEWYHTGKTEPEIAEYVASMKHNYVYPDPESPSAIEELRRRKVNVRDVIKGPGSVKSGIDRVRELLKAGKLKISNRCLNTITEFETYRNVEVKDEEKNRPETPFEGMDHAMDALRYMVMMRSSGESKAFVYKPSMPQPQRKAHVFRPGW